MPLGNKDEKGDGEMTNTVVEQCERSQSGEVPNTSTGRDTAKTKTVVQQCERKKMDQPKSSKPQS